MYSHVSFGITDTLKCRSFIQGDINNHRARRVIVLKTKMIFCYSCQQKLLRYTL